MRAEDKFRFLNFQVYQDAKKFYHDVVVATANFSRPYWELGDQMRRSALSVMLNLAEGSAKKSDKDFNRFIKISLGSINECVAGVDIAYTEKLFSKVLYDKLIQDAAEIASQLGGFSTSLK